MAAMMATVRLLAVVCVCTTVIQAYDEDAFDKLLKRIDALESQDRIQKRYLVQQEQLLERYEARMTLYENKLQEYSERIEQLENQLSPAVTDQDYAVPKPEMEKGPVRLKPEKTAEITNETVSKANTGNKKAAKLHQGIISANASHKTPRFVVDNGEGPVAFHATNDKRFIYNIANNQHILFEDVHLNLGNAFFELHGLFIAPRPGLYLFSVSIMSDKSASDIIAAILKDGKTLAKAYAGGSAYVHDQGSVTIVTELSVGSNVWISSAERNSSAEFGSMFISFMGYLLREA